MSNLDEKKLTLDEDDDSDEDDVDYVPGAGEGKCRLCCGVLVQK